MFCMMFDVWDVWSACCVWCGGVYTMVCHCGDGLVMHTV